MAKSSNSGQKFIGKNRAPRVQVEYDVELYGAEKKVNLPFVTGVMADLSGKPAEPLPKVEDRNFLDIDCDNFDERLKSMKPRVAAFRTSFCFNVSGMFFLISLPLCRLLLFLSPSGRGLS